MIKVKTSTYNKLLKVAEFLDFITEATKALIFELIGLSVISFVIINCFVVLFNFGYNLVH